MILDNSGFAALPIIALINGAAYEVNNIIKYLIRKEQIYRSVDLYMFLLCNQDKKMILEESCEGWRIKIIEL